eukprot:TRINITY_DN1408_c0_g2_i1.p1 TRINITY_DN1408_c0_g2~~TRINITY_DN1408_c0_g2_i1.p1  ORF type:complete len:800 (+),score=150.06 TRINITY_DN1408_c0_g2_i1:186-2585(+)
MSKQGNKKDDDPWGETTSSIVSKFVDKTLALLSIEREAEVEETKKIHEALPLTELERRGIVLKARVDGVRTGLAGKTLLEVIPPSANVKLFPAHRFQAGDIVGFRPSNCDSGPITEANAVKQTGVIFEVSEERIIIAFNSPPEEDLDGVFHLHLLSNDVTYRRMKASMEGLKKAAFETRNHVIDVLFGKCEPMFSRHGWDLNKATFFNKNLNQGQKEAIEFALCSNDIVLIHGPPGTGKTTTVVEYILQEVQRGAKVLACAPSNIAVDNMVEKLAISSPSLRPMRLGHPARLLPTIQRYSLDVLLYESDGFELVKDIRKEMDQLQKRATKSHDRNEQRSLRGELTKLRKEVKYRERQSIAQLIQHSKVVLSTNTGAADKNLINMNEFDVIVIDEAAQALEASCWIPILKGKKVVLAGDHLQLPPTIHSTDAAEKGLGVTLFDRLVTQYGDKITRMLTTQYRMHEDIMSFSSKELYQNRLVADASVKEHLLTDLPHVTPTVETQAPVVLIDTAGCGLTEKLGVESESKANEGEAHVVAKHVENLLAAGLKPNEIAIITPYNAQVDILRNLLKRKYETMEIGSVDGFQGREKEAIVISMVRSNAIKEVGFLIDDRRTNVAITRARRHLAVICDSETVSNHPFLDKFVKYCTEKAEYISASAYVDEQVTMFGPMKDTPDDAHLIYEAEAKKQKKNQQKKEQRLQQQKQQRSKAEGDEQPKISNLQVERNEKLRELLVYFQSQQNTKVLESLIKSFEAVMTGRKIQFPSSLSNYERKMLHQYAEELGLEHESCGEGKDRFIMI